MSAIYGRVGKGKPEGFQDIFEKEYRRKCIIDRFAFREKSGEYTASFGECLQYVTPESRLEELPIEASGTLFTADVILDNRAWVIEKIGEDEDRKAAEDLTALPDGALMQRLLLARREGAVKHFLGLFAYALYDEGKKRLTIATDHTSQRCLYYYTDGEQVIFSSIVSPMVKWCPSIGMSVEYAKDFLAAPGLMPNIVPGLSAYEGVKMVMPGSMVHFDFTENGIVETAERYIDWTTGSGIVDGAVGGFTKRRSPSQYLEDFRRIYRRCVADACRTADEVAISMSSGFDSASVGVLAAEALSARQQTLHTFTYVPYEKPGRDRNKNNVHDETEAVKAIGAMYPNMEQTFVNNDGKNCLVDLPYITDILEMPIKAVANMPCLFEVFRKAHEKNCRIVLTGQTGNATVSCGYIDHVLFDLYMKHDYLRLVQYLLAFSKDVKESRKQALTNVFKMCRSEKRKLLSPEKPDMPLELYEWVRPEAFAGYNIAERLAMAGISYDGVRLRNQARDREFMVDASCHVYLGGYETKAGLANGIVMRDPTRDPRIIWFCYNLPHHLYAYKGRTRWLIREGMKDMLPRVVTGNQLRYGVQNSDCGQRLRRDAAAVNDLMRAEREKAATSADAQLAQLTDVSKMPEVPENPEDSFSFEKEVETIISMGYVAFLNNKS